MATENEAKLAKKLGLLKEAYRQLQAKHLKNLQELEKCQKALDFSNDRLSKSRMIAADSVKVVKDLNDLLKSLERFKKNHPASLMSTSELLRHHKLNGK